jgi:hypothetical protein
MKHFLFSGGWLLAAIMLQFAFRHTGSIWFSLGAIGCVVLAWISYYKFARTL